MNTGTPTPLTRPAAAPRQHGHLQVVPPAAPDRSLAQRMEALGKANDIRIRRAQLKRDLKAGRVLVTDVLLDPPDWMETAKAFDFLLAVPKYGRVKVNKVFVQCRVSPSKTLGGMSQRQRTELVSMLLRPGARR